MTRKFSVVQISLCWISTVLWTSLVCYLLLWPADGTSVEDISDAFGGTDLTDSLGHAAMLFVEAALLYNLTLCYTPSQVALRIASGGTFMLGTSLECAQYWIPDRGFALYDLGANWLAVGLFVMMSRKLLPIVHVNGSFRLK